MAFIFYLLVFVFGTAVGSFLGVVVDRLNSKEPIWKGRSHCDHCRHMLHVVDLIPIVSFFLLKRKCRYCHKELSWFYPLVEVCTGIAYIAAAYVIAQHMLFLSSLQLQLLALYYFLLIGALIVIFFADIRYGIIPFKIVTFSLIISLLWYILLPFLKFTPLAFQLIGMPSNFLSIMGASLGAGGFFMLLFAVTRGKGMGFGDVVYAFLMGFILGFPNVLLGFYIAFVTGAIISIILVLLKKKKFRGGTIPFGPFLVFGTIVGLLWGTVLLNQIFLYFTL